jgi:guanine nucleotide-binding protein subunit beta-2-like 1 protein
MTEAGAIVAQDDPGAPNITSSFIERAVLHGHNLAVTSLHVSLSNDLLVSGSRDRTALVWRLPKQQEAWGTEFTRLVGHNHFVSDVSFSSDSSHLLTSSWDKTIRLWDLQNRKTKKLFLDHKKDVLATTFSPDNRRIISCSRDKTVKLWNILGECKISLQNESWPTSVSCGPMDNDRAPLIIAVGFWDGSVKLWSIGEKCEQLFHLRDGHKGRVSSVAFTPDGQWLITGGSDRRVVMWSVRNGSIQFSESAPGAVNAVAVCPTRAWICAACYEGIAIWDMEARTLIDNVVPKWPVLENQKRPPGRNPDCTAIAWPDDGSVLYAGYNNGEIRVWEVRSE